MVALEIYPNPNCPAMDLRVFQDLEPPQRVSHVWLERQSGRPAWCEVTGWTVSGQACPAVIQKVDDSGEGVALLLYGSDAGLRLQPAGQMVSWRLDDPRQWGEPFLLVADMSDVRLVQRSDSQQMIAGGAAHG